MKRNYNDYINDIIDAIDKIESFTKGMSYKKFMKDAKTIFAVTKALEIIGEASTKIPAEVKSKYPKIPWKLMTGMRNKLIHEYFGVDTKVVWETVKKDIPFIKPHIKEVLNGLQT